MAFTVPVENYVRSPYPSLPESKERYIQEELKKLERTLGTVSGALNDLKDVETQEDDLRAGSGFNTEVSLASATTTDIGGAGSLYVAVTGTATITSFGTNYSGPRFLRFTGALTLTNSASLVLPGGSNIVTAAGDTAIVVPQAAGWVVSAYQRASGVVLSASVAGTTTNDSAASGRLGEYVSNTVLFASRAALVSNTAKEVTSITLTAGDWDVQGRLGFSTDSTTIVDRAGGCINTSVAFSVDVEASAQMIYPGSTINTPARGSLILPLNRTRISLAATTTIYLVGIGTFTTAALAAYGHINARRVR